VTAVNYRLMRAQEQRAVSRLVGEVFGTSLAYQEARFASDPAAPRHTYVAIAEDGTLLSTLHYLVSRRRDTTGTPRRVGEVDSVTTLPNERGRGYASRLLELALAAMLRDGCDWSLLIAGEKSRPLYERHGWKCYGEPWRRGTVKRVPPSSSGGYVVEPYDPRRELDGWGRLAAIDIAFNRNRPLTVVRDREYWRQDVARRVGHWIETEGLLILAALLPQRKQPLCGYAMAEFAPSFFQVRDLAVLPEESTAISALLAEVAREADRRGIPLIGRMFLPHEPPIDKALDTLFGETLQEGQDRGHLMARTVGRNFTDSQLDALFAAPSATYSAIDHF
jgi:GNAT superfamily N-acetyltransferase